MLIHKGREMKMQRQRIDIRTDIKFGAHETGKGMGVEEVMLDYELICQLCCSVREKMIL